MPALARTGLEALQSKGGVCMEGGEGVSVSGKRFVSV